MSVIVTPDTFRPDRPQDVEVSSSTLSSALAHAAAGYPVFPMKPGEKKPWNDEMRDGSTDPRVIDAWWARWPTSDVGLVLDGLGLVVFDIDSAEGEQYVAEMVNRAGVALPATYEVTSGRGRHLYFRIPPGGRINLKTQQGSQHERKGLDVKLRWALVGAWSRHKSGSRYRGSLTRLPLVAELPCLPESVWAEIEARGREWAVGSSSSASVSVSAVRSVGPRREVPEALQGGHRVDLGGPGGAQVNRLLNDASDGRDARVFSVVVAMLRADVDPRDIWATLTGSPLGGKVDQEHDPVGYFWHKVDSAQACVDADGSDWDRDAWWHAVITAGLTDTEVRVLAHIGSRANSQGVVSRGVARIAYGSALSESSASETLARLRESGWLLLVRDFDPKLQQPRVYALQIPDDGQLPGAVTSAHTPLTLSIYPRNLTTYAGYDAFRCTGGKGRPATLNGGFRLLCLLHTDPLSGSALADYLRCSVRTVSRQIKPLVDLGVVEATDSGFVRTDLPLKPALDIAADMSGTAGRGDAQWLAYLAACAQWEEQRNLCRVVGTSQWRKVTLRDFTEMLARPGMVESLAWWRDKGVTPKKLAQTMADQYEDHLLEDREACVAVFADMS